MSRFFVKVRFFFRQMHDKDLTRDKTFDIEGTLMNIDHWTLNKEGELKIMDECPLLGYQRPDRYEVLHVQEQIKDHESL